jgi:hypothetical protein
MQDIRRSWAHEKSPDPQVHRSYTPGQPCKRGSSMAVRTPHVGAAGHSGRPARGMATHMPLPPSSRSVAGRATRAPAVTVAVHPAARAAVPKLVQDSSPPAQRRHPPHKCPGPEARQTSRRPSAHARPGRPRLGEPRGPPGRPHMEGTPGSAAPLKPGHAASTARPWPSVESPTVHTDRRNCAHRPPQLCTPTVVTVHTDRPYSTDARPLCVRGQRNMTIYSATR